MDVLVGMGLLDPVKLEDWRLGRVPYLEESTTAYMRWGKGTKRRLRFTKTGDAKLEEAYSRHFVWPGEGPFHPPAPRREKVPERSGSGEEGTVS